MAKGKSLNTLKVKVKADGTLSKKSLEEIRDIVKPSVQDKIAARITPDAVMDGLTFAGLTVGLKYGLINPFIWLMGGEWVPGKNIVEAMDELKGQMELLFDDPNLTEREEIKADMIRVRKAAEFSLDPGLLIRMEEQTRQLQKRLDGLPLSGDEENRQRFEVWFQKNKETIAWLVSMGLAGLSIKLAEQHTVAEIAELVPGQ